MPVLNRKNRSPTINIIDEARNGGFLKRRNAIASLYGYRIVYRYAGIMAKAKPLTGNRG